MILFESIWLIFCKWVETTDKAKAMMAELHQQTIGIFANLGESLVDVDG